MLKETKHMTSQRRKFTPAEREKILKDAETEGPKAAAEKHKVQESVIYRWRADAGGNRARAIGNVEISTDDEFITIRLPKKSVARELLADLL
jgi:transposase-like protein